MECETKKKRCSRVRVSRMLLVGSEHENKIKNTTDPRVFMRIKKKGESGEVAQYISRTQAVRKLQLSLPDFRCVLLARFVAHPCRRWREGRRVFPAC